MNEEEGALYRFPVATHTLFPSLKIASVVILDWIKWGIIASRADRRAGGRKLSCIKQEPQLGWERFGESIRRVGYVNELDRDNGVQCS